MLLLVLIILLIAAVAVLLQIQCLPVGLEPHLVDLDLVDAQTVPDQLIHLTHLLLLILGALADENGGLVADLHDEELGEVDCESADSDAHVPLLEAMPLKRDVYVVETIDFGCRQELDHAGLADA